MRKLNQLLKSSNPTESGFARRFLDAYGAKKPQDKQWRTAEARWEDAVNAWLKDRDLNDMEAERGAIQQLLTVLDHPLVKGKTRRR